MQNFAGYAIIPALPIVCMISSAVPDDAISASPRTPKTPLSATPVTLLVIELNAVTGNE